MTDLVLVRHGETEWNRLGRVQGRTDIPLNDTGREQARATARRLADEHFDAVAASPLSRAAETAQIIADGLGIGPVELVDALVERNYGESEGMTGKDIDAMFGGRLEANESREDIIARVTPALLAIAERHPGQRVLVVSHGGVIGSLVRDATRWVWPRARRADRQRLRPPVPRRRRQAGAGRVRRPPVVGRPPPAGGRGLHPRLTPFTDQARFGDAPSASSRRAARLESSLIRETSAVRGGHALQDGQQAGRGGVPAVAGGLLQATRPSGGPTPPRPRAGAPRRRTRPASPAVA